MKIIELRFKNLNSLNGEWVIDFTDPEYTTNGIFALTGPTGAGKSTILDAICLALYGATPRLGKITQSSNEIMSRKTGECYAEVVFESQAGRFRSHWEQRRARKKADGALQSPEHQVSEADSGKLLETKKSLVLAVIEENCGMDFDRFTRSMLLAQGGFDTFLKADAEQKSKILEQITGTAIYSEISKRVHEKQRDQKEALSLLQAQISTIAILDVEQEKEVQQELTNNQTYEQKLAKEKVDTEKAIIWLKGINNLGDELKSITKERETLQKEVDLFKPDRERLQRAKKAMELDGKYAKLMESRRQQEIDIGTLDNEEKILPELESQYEQQAKIQKSSEANFEKARNALKELAPAIQETKNIDHTLNELNKVLQAETENCNKVTEKIVGDQEKKKEVNNKLIESKRSLEKVIAYLTAEAKDEWLISGLAGIEEQLKNLIDRQTALARYSAEEVHAQTALVQIDEKLKAAEAQKKIRENELDNVVQELSKSEGTLAETLNGRFLREYREEKDALLREKTLLLKIAKLEEYRTKLEDGKACPLCGALDHPYAEGNVPAPDEIEKKIIALSSFIGTIEHMESEVKRYKNEEQIAHKKLNECEKIEVNIVNEKQAADKLLNDLISSLNASKNECFDIENSLEEKLEPLGISDVRNVDVGSLLESLKERLAKWQGKTEKKAEIEKRLAELNGELKSLDVVIETLTVNFNEKQKILEERKAEQVKKLTIRQELFGDKNPKNEEFLLNKAIEVAEQADKKSRVLLHKYQQQLTILNANIEALKIRVKKWKSDMNGLESEFESSLQPAGFIDEKEFKQACLSKEERDMLEIQANELDNKGMELKAMLQDREERLVVEKAYMTTDKSLDDLEPCFKEMEDDLSVLRNEVAKLKHQLSENTAAKHRIKEKQSVIESQKNICNRWLNLHALIGSADGKKFRNFAQGLTFELMVSHANRELEKMTGRYLLIRDDEQPLELNVVDNYQAGEIRSTKNLSGGESFIVSLTLALGLSKMASRKVRVDSLFLDEGFGTLDEEALESALETLSSLQQDGKLIGVISHVPALKERISTQIVISPLSGGKSTLIGPGCSKGFRS